MHDLDTIRRLNQQAQDRHDAKKKIDKVEESKKVTLSLERDEARVLATILANTGGAPEGPRGFVKLLLEHLKREDNIDYVKDVGKGDGYYLPHTWGPFRVPLS